MIEKEKDWYDEPDVLTTVLLSVIGLILILSQTHAIRNHLGLFEMIKSLINYSSVYIFFLAYFSLLKTKIGKKYFNLLNLILAIMYAILFIGSFFSFIQFFKLETLVVFLQTGAIFIYLVKVLLEETSLYKRLGLTRIPFDKINNDAYFYGVSLLVILNMTVTLFDTKVFYSVVLVVLETLFLIGFARYLYLYQAYKNEKKKVTHRKKKKEEKGDINEK